MLVLKHMPTAAAGIMVTGYDAYHARAKEAIVKRKITVTKGGADFETMMKEFRKTSIANAVERAKKRGVADPQKIVDAYLKNVAKWKKIVSSAEHSPAGYAKALWDNLYAEIDPEKL
jgi:hypothetical protein